MSSKRKVNGVIVGVIVGSLVFLGYQYFMAHENGQAVLEENTEESTDISGDISGDVPSDTDKMENSSSVRTFVNFVEESEPDRDDNYTQKAFKYLTNALKEVSAQAESGLDPAEVQALEDKVLAYDQNSDDPEALFMSATNTIDHIQIEGKSDDKISDLKKVVDEMSSAKQKEEVMKNEKDYFKKAADIMEDVKKSL